MANNEINLTLKITESGDLKVIGKKAEQAAAGLDKAGKSARTADRNLKGAAQASANGTKNFSKKICFCSPPSPNMFYGAAKGLHTESVLEWPHETRPAGDGGRSVAKGIPLIRE